MSFSSLLFLFDICFLNVDTVNLLFFFFFLSTCLLSLTIDRFEKNSQILAKDNNLSKSYKSQNNKEDIDITKSQNKEDIDLKITNNLEEEIEVEMNKDADVDDIKYSNTLIKENEFKKAIGYNISNINLPITEIKELEKFQSNANLLSVNLGNLNLDQDKIESKTERQIKKVEEEQKYIDKEVEELNKDYPLDISIKEINLSWTVFEN